MQKHLHCSCLSGTSSCETVRQHHLQMGTPKLGSGPRTEAASCKAFLTSSSLESTYSNTQEIHRLYTYNLLKEQKILSVAKYIGMSGLAN